MRAASGGQRIAPRLDQRLANGLRVVVVHKPGLVCSTWLWLEAGALDETPENNGAAHFLEHLVFKGTPTRGIGVASAEIERAGGDLNAFTSWDHTALQATSRAECWPTAVDVLADMALNPLFDPEELVREREVVRDEIRGYDDDVYSVVTDGLRQHLWPDHTYGRPVLGIDKTVRRLDRSAILGFWNDNWSADRATLVVVGPVDPTEVRTHAERAFGDWRGGSERGARGQSADPESGVYRVSNTFETGHAQLGWRAPPANHPEATAFVLLAALIGQGGASLLAEELQLGPGLASETWAHYSGGLVDGLFQIGLSPGPKALPAVLRRLWTLLETIGRTPMSPTRVDRVRRALIAQTGFDHETTEGIAWDTAWFSARHGSARALDEQLSRLMTVEPDELCRVAERWLRPEQAVVVYADPDIPPSKAKAAWRRSAPRQTTANRGDLMVTTLDNGARIAVLPDTSGVAAARLVSIGGALALNRNQAGLAAAWSEMISAGTSRYDAVGFRRKLDELAANFRARVGPSTLSVHMSFPSFELVESLETMLDASLKPRFSPTEWTRIQEELLDDLAGLADRPEEVAERAVDQRLWAGHPWRLPWGGTESSLARLTPGRLASWHEAQLDPSRLVLAVAGGIDPDQTTRVAARWLSNLGPAAPLAPRPALRPVSRTRMSRRAGHHQALVSVSWRTAGARDDRRRAYMAAAAVLDGAAGRLFMALRERLGLGYQVWADHRAGLDGGLFTAGLTCAPDMVERATDALLHEVYQLAATGPCEEELVRGNSILAGELADGWQRASVRASFLGSGLVLGLPWRPDEITRERQAVTPAQVRDALATLTEDRSVLVRVTPR